MSRWDAVGCDEDAEQIRGSPPFHETGSGCLPNFSHLGNVPQFLVGLGKCAVSFVNHYQVWPVIFHILPMVWQPLEEQTNPSSFRMPYRTTVSSICSTSSRRWVAIHTLCLCRSCKCSWMTDASEWSLPIPVGICTIMFLFNLHVSDTHSLMLCW